MKEEIRERLIQITGEEYVLEGEAVTPYLYDETVPLLRPEACSDCMVVLPENTQAVSAIMKLANEKRIPVVVHGGGTGLCGGVIPVKPSLIISMERLKRIIEIDEKNFIVTLESGVTLRELQAYLNQHSSMVYFAAHSCDENAQVGGMVAENAGGVKSGKRGVMRNNIRGLEIVLPTGEVLHLNGKLQKNNAGYDLMQLVIGSEGTLCVITKVMLHIVPKPHFSGMILVSFDDYESATDAATKVLKAGVTPEGIEYLDRSIARKTADFLHETWPLKKGKVDLMFIMAEENEDAIFNVCGMIEEICSGAGAVESQIYDGKEDQERILAIRTSTYHATKGGLVDTLDITVPPAMIPELMKGFDQIARKYGATFDTVGHVGDGNVHNNIYAERGKVPEYYDQMKQELYQLAIEMGGTITGEHGIGKIRRKSLTIQLNESEIRLMRGIKDLFDPNHILNTDTGII